MENKMKVNYQLVLEKTIKEIKKDNIRPSLLLHSCCAPCSSYVLEYLNQYFDITIFFYNPNMVDEEEFEKRYDEQVKINEALSNVNLINLIKVTYDGNSFIEKVIGMEEYKEGGIRCKVCFEMRLREAANYAKLNDFDYFTTTLSISPLKNTQLLNQLGTSIGEEYGVKYLQSDFKKKNGYKRSVELSKEYELYRQDYCGCVYSKKERENKSLKI